MDNYYINILKYIEDKEEMSNFQIKLFSYGYSWIEDGKKLELFFLSRTPYICLIDNKIYLLSKESLKYLKKDIELYNGGDVATFFRRLKFKKLKIH